jgi:lysyl-tRNA synthetase class 2
MHDEIRQQSLINWSSIQSLYPDSFPRTHTSIQAVQSKEGITVSCAGRVVLMRQIGKITFFHLKDFHGKIQCALKADVVGDKFEFFCKNLDLGDIVGVTGSVFLTKTGEKTIEIHFLQLLSKCLHPLPEKWHGLADEEIKLRQRYLDILCNEGTLARFKKRNKIIATIRRFLELHSFIEVETPILQKQASGALATPFETHHNALDIPLFLRIAPETYLKRLMVGGYERVFEIGKVFRNEGMDSSHLQEFTMLEFYVAYWNYEIGIEFIQNLFKHLFAIIGESENVEYEGHVINFATPWERITYNDLVKKHTNINLEELIQGSESHLIAAIQHLINPVEYKSIGSMIDALYKKHCRPHLINPTIVTNQPAILGPLARQSDANPHWSDRFQVVICGHEIVNAYSELVNPELQRKTLLEQQQLSQKGEIEAMVQEDDFLLAMEYAMPPMAGFGIGIDRLVTLLTSAKSIRDVVFFPIVK